MDNEEFARQVDALAKEVLEWIQFEETLAAATNSKNPVISGMMKMWGHGDPLTLQLRNLCYNCALRKPEETKKFMEFLWDKLTQILGADPESRVTLIDDNREIRSWEDGN